MKKHILKNIIFGLFAIVFISLNILSCNVANAISEVSFNLSPMNEVVTLNPGDIYRSTFTIRNMSEDKDLKYKVVVKPYYVDDDNIDIYDSQTSSNLIVDWITIVNNESGTISPVTNREIEFNVNVPSGAPAGGQYAAITVMSNNDFGVGEDSVGINENIAIAYLFYAEITGNTIRKGEIIDASVPNFLLSGEIKGVSSIKNVGNVHGVAKYTLQVFPLFSSEEIYTNEETPSTAMILPDRTLYNETVWNATPTFGIFNVIYTVEFEGVTTQVSKMVIKCPIWLLFIIIFGIIALIIWFFLMAKKRRTTRRER